MWTSGDLFKTVTVIAFLFCSSVAVAQMSNGTPQRQVKMTEWRDETGAPRPERVAPVWKGENRIERVPGSEVKAKAPTGKYVPRIALLVEHNLRLEIGDALAQYQADLADTGYSTFVVDVWGGTPGFVRETLQDAYAEPESIEGAVLMGDISYIEYEVMQKNNAGNWEREAFPCDLHYMDLDGVWSDTLNDREVVAGNGFYDTWTETDDVRELEIWVCRLPTHNMPKLGDEVDLMNSYFTRNHRYRLQRQSYTGMLVYPDDDWSAFGPGDQTNAERVYDPCLVTAIYDRNETTATDYMERLANPVQMLHIRSHGYPGGHGFSEADGEDWGNVTCATYRDIDPQARFYSLFVCSGCDYTAADFLGGTTVLNPEGGGLLAVGSTKSGGMLDDVHFYTSLQLSACFGRAFVSWYNALPNDPHWRYGMVLIGDATLTPKTAYNDDFIDAREIMMNQDPSGAYRAAEYGDNRCATVQSGEPNHAGLPCAKSLWWHYTPSESGLCFLDTFGSSFNTQLAVYTGGSVGTLTLVAADGGDKEASSQVTFTAAAGTTYRIAVDGSAIANGYITMNCALFSVPLNDNFADAVAIGGERGSTTGHNFSATGETGETAHGPEIRSVWWVWNAPKKCRVYFDTVGSDFNTVLGAYTGTSPDALTEIAFNDDTDGEQSEVLFLAEAGQSFHILVDGAADGAHTETGNIFLNWQIESMPATDMFADRETIRGMGGVAQASNVGASKETGEPNHAGNAGGKSVWWRFDPPVVELGGDGNTVTFTTKGSSFNTTLAVYTGSSVNNLTLVASNNNAASGVIYSTVSFPMQGTYYAIAVDGYNAASGNIVLTWNVNDNFADSLNLGSASSGDKPGSTLGATKETDEPTHADFGSANHSVWYTWMAPANGLFSVTTAYGAFRVFVDIYTGEALAELETAPGRQLLDGRQRVTCCVEAGTVYHIAAATVEQTDFYLVWELATGTASLDLDVSAGQGGIEVDGAGVTLPYSAAFDRCESVQLKAVPTILGWKFLSWSGDVDSSQNPITVSLAENKTISAAFRECEVRTLSIDAEGPGTIRVNGVTRPLPYTGSFNDGDSVAVVAFPAAGYALGEWSGDITSVDNPLFLTMDQDYSIPGSFLPKQMAAIGAVKDATLYFDLYGTIANGSGQYLFAGLSDDASPLKRRAALQFDVASILPADAHIVDAQLKLYHEYLNSESNASLTITKIARSWGEGASDAEGDEAAGTTALTDDVTWRHRFSGGEWWSMIGGDVQGTTTAQAAIGGEGSWTIASLPGGSRAQIIADVQSWLDQPDSNNGWMLKSDESTITGVKRLASREHPDADKQPRLVITYVSETSGEGEGEEPCTEYTWAQTAPEIGGTSMVAGVSVSEGGTVMDVNITVNITQYANNETTLSLESPSGTIVYLIDQNCTGYNMINTVFDDEASVSINDGTAPYAGTFRPVQPLSVFIGEPANGPWKLHVADSALSGEDYDLTLNSWSLCLSTEGGEGEGESGCTQYPAVDTPVTIDSGGVTTSSIEIFDTGVIQDLNMVFDMPCESTSAFELRLTSPQGTEVLLFSELDHNGENFEMTELDDEAAMSIYDGYPPYNASYIPQQAFSAFDGESMAGVWQLTITGMSNSEGTLNAWHLCIQSEATGEGEGEEGCTAYTAADTPVTVPAEGGGASSIEVADTISIADINITLTLACGDATDISLFLESPGGNEVKLVETAASAGANFTGTTFDDEAAISIYDGTVPYTGSFRPASLLSALDGESAAGTWTLHVLNADTHSAEITSWSACILPMPGEGAVEGEGGGEGEIEGEGEVDVCLESTASPSGSLLFSADFEDGLDGFEIDNSFGIALGLWRRTDTCIAADPGHSSSFVMYFGETSLCSYDYGDAEQGVITSPEIDLTTAITPELRFAYFLETELSAPGYDYATVEISADGGAFEVLTDNSLVQETPPHLCDPSGAWKQAALDLSAYTGSVIRVRFGFNSVDAANNDFDGFAVDDVAVYDITPVEGEGGEEGPVEGEVEGEGAVEGEGGEEGPIEGEVEGEGAVEGGEEGPIEG
ncbi:MAG TPA: proprotein convertase P-domain-containing protein, partial [Candidatus Hydrogenedentes bacterium]|nr:proprotein convertase P-domain-containing protein [Candidatus Hydrogenedentota bacterium]